MRTSSEIYGSCCGLDRDFKIIQNVVALLTSQFLNEEQLSCCLIKGAVLLCRKDNGIHLLVRHSTVFGWMIKAKNARIVVPKPMVDSNPWGVLGRRIGRRCSSLSQQTRHTLYKSHALSAEDTTTRCSFFSIRSRCPTLIARPSSSSHSSLR